MIISGKFRNVNEDLIEVVFWSQKNGDGIFIGEANDGTTDLTADVMFAANPIVISSNCDDTFQEIIIKNCSITLLTKHFLGDILYSELGQVRVNVTNITKKQVLFAGFVEPEIYSQPFAYDYEELTINCIDALGLLQYIPYGGQNYDIAKQNASMKSFVDVIDGILDNKLNVLIDEDSVEPLSWLYVLDNEHDLSSDLNTRISEHIFLGETIDDCVNKDEALRWVLRYFNLHIIQEGEYFYIFNRNTIKLSKYLEPKRAAGNTPFGYADGVYTMSPSQIKNGGRNEAGIVKHIELTIDDYADDGTTINMSDVYNKISIKCERNTVDSLFESPLESSLMTSPYVNKQFYMSQFNPTGDTPDENDIKHWFFRYKESKNWYFNYLDYTNNIPSLQPVSSLIDYTNNNTAINQYKVLQKLNDTPYCASLLSFGKVGVAADYYANINCWNVNSVVGSPDMKDRLIISVNGMDDEQKLADLVNLSASEGDVEDDTILSSSSGLVEYRSGVSMVFSPADENVTNYIVFSGNIMYVPILEEGNTSTLYKDEYKIADDKKARFVEALRTHPNDYTEIRYPFMPFDYNTYPAPTCVLPPIDELPKALHYEYNADHSQVDKINKMDVLQCVLKIGDKYLKYGTQIKEGYFELAGTVTKFEYAVDGYEWVDYFSTFNLSVNPKQDDYIIGQKFELLNDVSTMSGIEIKGMCIPIKASDNLAGKVEFKILGPYNNIFEHTTKKVKRKLIFWKKTTYNTEDIAILSKTKYIDISDFECKFVTDNGKIDLLNDADLMYYSDENIQYLNEKDDIDFYINSALTLDESKEIGVNNITCLNNPIDADNKPVTKLSLGDKAERLYINDYYNEYKQPKMIVDTTLRGATKIMGDGITFKSFSLGEFMRDNTFYVLSSEYDVYNDNIKIRTKNL